MIRPMQNATQKYMRKSDLNIEIIPGLLAGKYDMPVLSDVYSIPPERMIPFNMAKSCSDTEAGIHFFIDDYQFDRVWRFPQRYVELLRKFKCVCTPDFSLYAEMPLAMKIWNVYRSHAIGVFWQEHGLNVIPTLQWAEPRTFHFCFSGVPSGTMVAVSTLGAAKSQLSRKMWTCGMEEAVRRLCPTTVLLYGSPIDFDFGNINVIHYENETIKRMRNYGRQRGNR